jgi:hypothetical protein
MANTVVPMENIVIPVDLTAFALSPPCCDEDPKASKIAPITQPNYIGLRLDDSLIRHDLLDPIDFHLTSPATLNPRLTDLGTVPPQFRANRLGIYLHWSLPRLYRSARADADSTTKAKAVKADPTQKNADPSNPVFRNVPNRWLVVRHLRNGDPPQANTGIPDFQSWVIESDRLRKIDQIEQEADLETDVSPFVAHDGGDPNALDALQTQAEVFIGMRNKHSGWSHDNVDGRSPGWSEDTTGQATHTNLTIMNSSNPLFPGMFIQRSNHFC